MNFSTSGSPMAPRRFHRKSLWKGRGAFFGACLLGGAGMLAISNRALSGLSIFPDSNAVTTPLPDAQARAREKKRNRSLSNAIGKIDAKTVAAWVQRWSESARAAGGNGPRLVRIDAEILARHHPAWRLADALERGTISPLSPQIARALSSQWQLGAAANLTRAVPSSLEIGRTLPATMIGDTSSSGELRRLNARQNAALGAFFRAAATRDALRGRDEAFLSRRELEDAIAAAQNGVVPDLDLSLMSPEVALELTNLRLQLLRNLTKTPAQRAAVREEIRVIEARYAQILREETARQAARLRAARIEIPLRKRREGTEAIARANRVSLQNRSAARRALSNDLARLRPATRDETAFEIALPPARAFSTPDFGAFSDSPAREKRATAQLFETDSSQVASHAPIPNWRDPSMGEATSVVKALGTEKRGTTATIASLRRKARAQAGEWARLAAGNLGAIQSDSPRAPDATETALQILFPASTR